MLNELNIRRLSFMEWEPAPLGFRFDLQRFAAEDEGRTEEPTDKKPAKRVRRGRSPRHRNCRRRLSSYSVS